MTVVVLQNSCTTCINKGIEVCLSPRIIMVDGECQTFIDHDDYYNRLLTSSRYVDNVRCLR